MYERMGFRRFTEIDFIQEEVRIAETKKELLRERLVCSVLVALLEIRFWRFQISAVSDFGGFRFRRFQISAVSDFGGFIFGGFRFRWFQISAVSDLGGIAMFWFLERVPALVIV